MDARHPPLAGPEQHYQRHPPPHHHQHPHPPPTPVAHPHAQGSYTPRHQSLPGVDTFAPPSHPYPGPPPPPPPPPPPLPLPHSHPHSEASERPEHAYTAPPAVHGNTLKTDSPSGPPAYQRPPSNPSQQPPPTSHPPHSGPPASRPQMEHPTTVYAQHPHPPAGEPHVIYTHTPMMEHYGPPPHPGYFNPNFMHPNLHMTSSGPRKKSMRASQACDRCRERKSKCDENRPCQTCKDQNLECIYKDTHPSKADKTNAQMSDLLQQLVGSVESLHERIASMEKTYAEASRAPRVDTPNSDQQLAPVRRESLDDRWTLGEHTTAAHKLLLLWPSIDPFIRNSKIDIRDNYVMKGEDRGLLRLYGPGERSTDDRVAIGAASPAHSSNSDDWSASPPDFFHDGEPRRSEPFMVMDVDTLNRLFNSYKKNIHRLHPFVDIDSLNRSFKEFVHKHCGDRYSHSPMFVANSNGTGERDVKRRKRPDGIAVGLLPSDYFNNLSPQPSKRLPERTLINAIIYLVLALGKVCEAGDPIPGPVQEYPSQGGKPSVHHLSAASPIARPSPSSPNMTLNGSMNPPARASSWDGSPAFDKRQAQNVDKIPGLAYYREACSILGDFSDSNELACAQARLLAGLYKGQLARVQESWSWINSAARTCLYRMRIDGLDKSKDLPYGYEFSKNENLTLLAYWTCLQLESDILAEWDYPGSGLSGLESRVSWPANVVPEPEEDAQTTVTSHDSEIINFYYSAQLFLRKRLNQIHARLYGSELSKVDPKVLSQELLNHDDTLSSWRNMPMQVVAWSDDEAPASDILAARLRGKYYGARYVATRPFLDYALHVMNGIEEGKHLEELTRDASDRQRDNELALFKAMLGTLDADTIKEKCRICVESAMKSTVAFDGVDNASHRLIVTNIMGTAHAQFGNMLVLSAVHDSKIDWLRALVPASRLQPLMRRTIKFIRRLYHASNTAQIDVMILEQVERTLFANGGDDKDIYENERHTGESFTS